MSATKTPRPKTPCHHCGKLYVNVKEHITKSHSWLQLHCKDDGEIVFGEEHGYGTLFWQDHIWKDCAEGYRTCEEDEHHTSYFSDTREDMFIWVHIKKHPTLPGMWTVLKITTDTFLSDEAVRRNGGIMNKLKEYTNVNIQVLHKRVPS